MCRLKTPADLADVSIINIQYYFVFYVFCSLRVLYMMNGFACRCTIQIFNANKLLNRESCCKSAQISACSLSDADKMQLSSYGNYG